MTHKCASNSFLLLLLPLVLLLTSACNPAIQSLPAPSTSHYPPVDPLFREFYNLLGGKETLGPAISPLGTHEHFRFQYTIAGLMVYDAQAPSYQRLSLAPLGLELVSEAPAIPKPANVPDERYVGGHVIYEKFFPTYQRLQGARFVGKPITEMTYNPEKKRFEQYFENLGFYILEDDPLQEVHLLAYGAFKCDRYCRYPTPSESIPARQEAIPAWFAEAVARISPSFTGRKISEPIQTADGTVELIFDNLVLYVNPNDPAPRVHARPIIQTLGIEPHPLVLRTEDPRLDFYLIEGEQGHNVPVIFTEYLTQHGGLDIAGQPITEIFPLDQEKEIWRQCFTNLCLDYYHKEKDKNLKVRPAALGLIYKLHVYGDQADPQSLKALSLRVWEARPLITSAEAQEIFVAIFENKIPLENLEPELYLTNPVSGEQAHYRFPPTDVNGFTQLDVEPVQARNGTIIPYQVCLQNIDQQKACVDESYIIWGNP